MRRMERPQYLVLLFFYLWLQLLWVQGENYHFTGERSITSNLKSVWTASDCYAPSLQQKPGTLCAPDRILSRQYNTCTRRVRTHSILIWTINNTFTIQQLHDSIIGGKPSLCIPHFQPLIWQRANHIIDTTVRSLKLSGGHLAALSRCKRCK